jgi:hypothetical protein
MATKVIKSNLLSESWQNVYDLLNDSSNIKNPVGNKKWVYSREPSVKSVDFSGFPYLVVSPSVVDFGDEQTCDGQLKSVNFSVQVDVVTSDSMRDKGKGAVWNDQICDEIISLFNSSIVRNTLRGNGLFFSVPNVSSVVVDEVSQTTVFRRTILLSFGGKKKVF